MSKRKVNQDPNAETNLALLATVKSNSRPPSQSQESVYSSEVEADSAKVRLILVSSRVSMDPITIKFSINSNQRSDTDLSGSQGDHAIAYTAVIESLLTTAENGGVRNAINAMTELGRSVFEGTRAFREFGQTMDLKPEVHKRGDRESLKSFCADATPDVKAQAEIITNEAKHSKVVQLADHLCDLTSCFLTEIQKQPLTTFYSKGRIKEPAGDTEKGAVRALTVLDMICELRDLAALPPEDAQGNKKFTNKIQFFAKGLSSLKRNSSDTEDEHVARYGLSRWYQDNGKKADQLLAELKKINAEASGNIETIKLEVGKVLSKLVDDILSPPLPSINPPSSEESLKKIAWDESQKIVTRPSVAKFMGDLLDYKREISFDLNEAFPLTKEERKGLDSNARNQAQLGKAKDFFKDKMHSFSISQEDGEITLNVTRENTNSLMIVVNKHLTILAAAFPKLRSTLRNIEKTIDGNESQSGFGQSVTDQFLQEEVLTKSGWNLSKVKANERDEFTLGLEQLKDQINPTTMRIPEKIFKSSTFLDDEEEFLSKSVAGLNFSAAQNESESSKGDGEKTTKSKKVRIAKGSFSSKVLKDEEGKKILKDSEVEIS